MISVALRGFGRAIRTVAAVAREIRPTLRKSMADQADFIRQKIIEGIESQAPGGKRFVPLKPSTVARKGHSDALIMTRALIQAISTQKVGEAVFAGISARFGGRSGGITVLQIGMIHEYGAPGSRIPARPFIRPVIEKYGGQVGSEIVGSVRSMASRLWNMSGG